MARPDCSPVSATVCWVTYAIAISVGIYAHLWLDQEFSDYDALLRGLGANVAATVVVFLASLIFNNSSLYDPYWVIPPPLLATKWVFDGAKNAAFEISRQNYEFCGGLDLFSMCAAALVWAWAIRFVVGCPWSGWRTGIQDQDWRYVDMLKQLRDAKVGFLWWVVSFFSLHLTPTILVHLALAPLHRVMTVVNLDATKGCSTAFQLFALFFTCACLLWQWIADEQLRVFRESLAKAGPQVAKIWNKTMRDGLWMYSRHPNYFGEVMFWISIYTMHLARCRFNPVLIFQNEPWLVIGAVVMCSFFRFASVKMMDDRSLAGARAEEYKAVMAETSPLVPWPPAAVKKQKREKTE